MLIKGLLATEMSGSIAGITASHNAGGQYFRARAVPVNPGSTRQDTVRGALSALTIRWNASLTQAQRDAWGVYAKNVSVKDRLGATRQRSGINWYCACNSLRAIAGMLLPTPYIDDAPTVFTGALLTPPSIVSATAATDVLSISFENTNTWASAVGGALLVFAGIPQNAGVSSYQGPYRYSGKIPGAVVPPTSPLPITSAYPFGVGNRVFVRFRSINLDGRISPSFQSTALGA